MNWWRRGDRERDLERELRADLELEAEEQRERGLSETEARYAARRAFGNVARIGEDTRAAWGWTWVESLLQDMRYAFRTLRKAPGFAITALLTLALGIGAATAVFTTVDSVILQPLAYRDSGRLVVAWESVRFLGESATGPNPRHVDLWRQRATAFTGFTQLRNVSMGLTVGTGHPTLVGTVRCQANLFDVLQVRPMLGRAFLPENGVEGHENVVVLTYPLWQTLFHGDPGAIGQTIRIDNVPREVIGVLPAGFQFPNGNALRPFRSRQPRSGLPEPAVFLPVVFNLSRMEWNGNYGNWLALARLKPGVTIREAEAQLKAIQVQVQKEFLSAGDPRPGAVGASLQPMREAIVAESKNGLWLLMAAVAGLMLIACLNLANTQLGRGLAQRRDAAVRTALGAARWRLVWSAMAENLLLAAAGGAGGVLLAAAGLALFRRHAPIDLPRLSEVHLNLTVLLFSAGLAIAASLLFGVAPAVKLTSTDPQASLHEHSTRTAGSRSGQQLRAWLIGVQVFGCSLLLLVTGLFAKSLLHLLHQDKGFDTERVAIAEVSLPPRVTMEDRDRIAFNDAVLENLRQTPGVESAGMVSAMPLEGETWIEFLRRADRPNQETPMVNARWVSAGYFETTRQRLVAGRFFEERDRDRDNVVISESEAKVLWGGESPIGSRVNLMGRAFTVIGVAADSHSTSLKLAPTRLAFVYYTYRTPYSSFFVARSTGAPESLLSGMRQAIWKYAPDATVARVKTLDAHMSDSLAPERFQTLVLAAFGAAALLLAMLGIYGVLSYSVATRKQEIGVRMALGASRASVYAMTLRQAGAPVLIGLVAGLAAALEAGRLIQKLLYGVQAEDPAVMAMVAGLFLSAAAAAAFLPARRAASLDPMDALRTE